MTLNRLENLLFKYEGEERCRLDLLLLHACAADERFSWLTRSQLKQLIQSGQVKLDGEVVKKAGSEVRPGNMIEARLEVESLEEIEPYDFALEIIHEDEALLVVNKPAGLTVHPGAGNPNKTLLNAVIHYGRTTGFEVGPGVRFGIVHRLDRDTTGLLVVAKTVEAHGALSEQFARHTIQREYEALVFSTPRVKREVQLESVGAIETLIGRHPGNRTAMAVVDAGGRKAVTHWEHLEECEYCTRLRLRLETGRTHQIRVHMEHLGSPVLGDQVYNRGVQLPKVLDVACAKFGRQALHARALGFLHPMTGEKLEFAQEPPSDYLGLLETFRAADDS